jgi:amino acid adenylation domain-containing protein/non-ribosomal peptide synthase protein (TIGR01720 family)
MSVEQQPADTLSAPYRKYGFDLSSSLSDGGACAREAGQRRVLECAPFPAGTDEHVCVAAWHGVLHWLRYSDEPVITCMLGAHTDRSWPIVTAVDDTTSLGELLGAVSRQWMQEEGEWLDPLDPNHAGMIDQLRCHAIHLHDAAPGDGIQSEFALVRTPTHWRVDCDASRFSESYQQLVTGAWQQIIVRMLANPESLLSAEDYPDRNEIRATSPARVIGPIVPIAGSLVERFAERVTADPHKTAVVDAGGRVSFAELHAISDTWAEALCDAGLSHGDYVGVAFDRGHRMVAAQLAVLKAGAVFVPMDATQPATRLQAMADDTEMRFVLIERALAPPLRAALPDVRCVVVEDLPAGAGARGRFPRSVIATDDLAYVIFTSGSTGRPKGVKVSHGNLLNFIVHLGEILDVHDVCSQFAPFTFDASVAEIHSTILNGITLVIPTAQLIDDPDRLQAYMTEQCVTFAAFPPQYAKHLEPAKLPLLRVLMTAGSVPDHELIKRWQPHLKYINAYGPTETTILSTAWHASRVPEAHEPITIGSPVANTEVRVVNRFNRSLPRGVVGELLIGGAGVTHGYLKREELTRERFITLDRERWYRSGDLSCFDQHDQLIFAGRVDNQVKVRGHRLELGEVETALLTITGVVQAAVVVVEVQSAKQLVAFCIGEQQSEDAMRESLRQVLPAWALPNRILWLPSLPLTPNGKTDYRSLQLQLSRTDTAMQQGDYADEREAQVAAIWGNVLQQPGISRDANFIHLGGDSLTALVVMSALKRLGYQVTSSQLLAHPRLCDFARLLGQPDRDVHRDYASCRGNAALSPIQGWFFSLQLDHPGEFCQTLVFETDEWLDVDRLHDAFCRLCTYHDQLRARFVRTESGAWRQEIASDAIELPRIALLDLPEHMLDETTTHCRKKLATQLRIEQEPLFRVALVRTPTRSRVVWVLHHLIVDTISHGILLDDLRQLYDNPEADVAAVLPGKSLGYLSWSGKLDTQIAEHASAQLDRWLPLLHNVERAEALPLAYAVDARRSIEIAECRLSRQDTSRLIEDAPGCYRQTAEELVLAATCLALARALKIERIAIDVEWHGRDEAFAGTQGLDRTVGWFTSVHPLGMTVPAKFDLGEWLTGLKETRAAVPDRGRDFYALRYLSTDAAVRARFDAYRQPEVLFNFSGVLQRRRDGWRTVPVVAIEMGEGNASPYALSVESEIRDGELIVGLYFDPDAWPGGNAGVLSSTLHECLQQVIEHCCVAAHQRWTPSDFPALALTQAQVDQLPRSVKTLYSLTDMQQTMLRHMDTYQVVMCYRIPCPFDEALWKSAVADWIGRHDCLRSFIKEWDGNEACQVVLDDSAPPLTVHHVASGTSDDLAMELIRNARSEPVQLARAPLFDMQAIDEARDGFLIVLAIHHIIHDGWSIDLLLQDLLQTYRYFRSEIAHKPAAPLASVADIVAQQRLLRASADWCAYWSGLPWEPIAGQLPQQKSGKAQAPDTQLYVGAIDPRLALAARAKARSLGVTVNSLWLAGYVCLLRYLGGLPQVRCGVIQNGRMEEIPGVETITGCCVNTLPLVLNITPEQTGADVLAAVNDQLHKMRAAAAFPLSCIHEAVRPRLDDELFSTLFNIESQRYAAQDDEPRATLEGGYESTNYRFIFSLIERGHADDAHADDAYAASPAYGVRIGYDASLYDVSSIARWLEIYAQCMHALLDQTNVPWNQLQLLPEEMRRQIVTDWNRTEREYPHERCVPELFREQVARIPDHPALLYKETHLSYAELDARSEQLARVLQAEGVQPETIVGLVAERSVEMVVAILAIFKAGGAYVPIDPRYPADRVRHMIQDTDCHLVLIQRRSLAQTIPADLAVTRLYLDEPLTDAPGLAPDVASAPRDSRQLAYVMYTSGSTGNPKGVMIEHRSIARLVRNSADIAFAPEDRILLTSAPGFDVTTFEVWSALLNGLTLAIVDEETLLDPQQLVYEIRQKRITALWLIAPLFNQLVQEKPDMFAGVKHLLIGGDALSAPHVHLARKANPGLQVINGYGPTENTSFSTYHFVEEADASCIPIGRPITNSTAYIFNRDGQLLPVGVDGELYVGGPGVARGYLNQPELTTAKFLPDPFSTAVDARLYRTGDLVRWRADGLIDFLGRIDHQVKIRGFRVELGEIENALCSHEHVKQAVVLVKQDGNQKQLIGYVVARDFDTDGDGQRTSLIRSIVAALQPRLPDYMVPAAFVILDAMPRNANGKIDRARLPEPDQSAYAHSSHVEPENERERILWSIWKEVLGIDSFGVTDNFFAIGGDSILAIQLVSRAAKQGLIVTQRQIVEEQTIRNLARKLAQHGDVVTGTKPSSASPSTIKGEQRLLPIQLEFLQDDRVDANHYCQYALIALPEGTAREALEAALAAVVVQHDVMRLRFRETPTGWVAQYRQDLLADASQQIDECLIEKLVEDSVADDEAGLLAEVADAQADLDVKTGKLFKWVWFKGTGKPRLLWVMHHLVVDAVSWRILQEDLQTALAQCGRGEPLSLGDKSTSYQEWAARLHDYAYGPSLESEKSYWLRQLAQPSPRIAFDEASRDGQDQGRACEDTTAHVDVALGRDETSRLLNQANAYYDTQTHQLMIAGLGRALGEWLESDHVRIDLESHGRASMAGEESFDDVDLSQTVGWFTTLYPVHLGDTRADLGTYIHGTRERLLAVPHNGIGYGALVYLAQDEELDAARARVGGQESDVLFNYLGQFNAHELGGSFVSPRRQRSHALRITGQVKAGILSLRFDFSQQQLQRTRVESVAARFIQILRDIIDHCAGPSSPNDRSSFPLAGISKADLASLRAKYPKLQDLYPCTGMQQGLLLFADRASHDGLYLTQLRMDLEAIDPARLRNSWQVLVRRHDILRTAFVDVGQSALLQAVMTDVDLPWREVDVRAAISDKATQQPDLERLLSDERAQTFDWGIAPLMRLLLVRVTDRRYCLAWTHHHALLDGWSMGLLIKELFAIYSDLAGHASATTAIESVPPYKDYIAWLRSRDHEAAASYWQGYFGGLDIAASASLPIARARVADPMDPQAKQYAQKAHAIELPAETTLQLSRLAKTEGVSLSTLMLAAWGLLQSKYNAEQEVLFGYTTSGRPAALVGVESMIGLFINSLPIRLRIEAGQSLSSWLKVIQRRQLDHEDHGFVALGDIQRHSGIRAGQALFDALVVVENFPLDRSLLSSPTVDGPRLLDVEGIERSSLGLNLIVYPGERLTLKLAYRTQLFDDTTARTLLRHLCQLLISFAKGGSQAISQLSILSDEERQRAIREWNDSETADPLDRRVSDGFDEQVWVRGSAHAIVAGAEHWTYQQLAERERAIALWLRDNGVAPGDKVALSLGKEPDLIAAMLGIIRAGAAYVPIALDCPLERRSFILADAGIRWTVTRRSHLEQLGNPQDAVLFLDECPRRASTAECDALDEVAAIADSHATAYVIYTSGTTGTPKGVPISHRNLINFCTWCTRAGLFKAGDPMTQFAPYTFDASAGEIFGALLAGAELHLLASELIQDPQALTRYLSEHGIRFAAFPPPYLQQMDPALVPAGLTLLTAGSAPTPELVQRWSGHCRYINGYGPTETTILSSAWTCEHSALDVRTLSIGRPINNTSLYVVDNVGQLCAPGLIGEIYIGGEGVAAGYINRPELTAQQFIADPWRPGARVYRTGDMGRWLEDGTIEFIGRRDRQVKLRGFRIELNEIESRLREHPAVAEATVSVRGDDADKQLLAWIVPRSQLALPSGNAELIQSLREFIRLALPEYMLPQAIVVIDRLPLTANGKVDEAALPPPERGAWFERQHVVPRTAAETQLAEIWASVLKLPPDQISATADFFDLGGHSLLAMRVISQLREKAGVDISVADLLARPVLADLAVVVQNAAHSVLPPIAAVERGVPLPLSFAQQRMWLLAQMEGVSGTYHVPGALRLKGRLDRTALRCALDRIVARHEVLRTTFEFNQGEPLQRIGAADAGFTLLEHDLRERADAEAALQRLMDEEVHTAFDLSRGPLIRGRLIQRDRDEHVLLITIHHIVVDGWSLGLLIKELGTLYNAYCANQADPLPALPIQYADYAAWQRRWLAGEVLREQNAYWQGTLQGSPVLLELPTDRPRPVQQTYAGDVVELAFDESLTAALKALSQRHGATLFMTLLAGWAIVLSRISGQHDVVIGSPIANRARAEIEPLIGFFVNTLALRVDVSGDPAVSELLGRVKHAVLGGQRHQQLPFEQVVELVQAPRTLSHSPVFQVMLNWLDERASTVELEGLDVSLLRAPYVQAKFDLTLDLSEAGGRIVGGVEYATALFDRSTIERHVGHLRRVLEAMVADERQCVQRVDLLADDERRLLLHGFNDTRRPELAERRWMALFDAQVAGAPDAVALIHEDRRLGYRELDQRSNRLAHYLRSLGVGPEVPVGLCCSRSIEMVVGLLGVLKAGGAYVPLDPQLPPQRLEYMLADVGMHLILTEEALASGCLSQVETSARLLRLDADWSQVANCPTTAPPNAIDPDHLAYIIYTSGSTGQPKGVMIEHRGLNNYLCWACDTYRPDEGAVVSSSLAFDATLTSLLTPLLHGSAVHLLPERGELLGLAQLVRDGYPGMVKITPAHLDVLAQQLFDERAGSNVALFVIGGEALAPAIVERWRNLQPRVRLVNEYGPTETVVGCVVHEIPPDAELRGNVPIGRPIANTRIYVLDAQGQPAPIGATGEMYIGGDGVARGYLNRANLTAERFLHDPFVDAPARMYRTGDLARYLPDGTLEYFGRTDHQVKIRGYRIELGEVESCLVRFPAVREAVVVAREQGQGGKQLVAYVTHDGELCTDALRAHLHTLLPEYMVPAVIVILQALPLTLNGKIDRNALPAPGMADLQQAQHETPAGDTEQALAEIWRDLLRVEQVGRRDDFFELGGNSLLAVRMVSQARQRLGVDLGLVDLFARPVLADLAMVVQNAARSTLPSITTADRDAPLALSFAQQRLWFLAQMEGGAAYHVPGVLRLAGVLDKSALRRTLERIVARHEALRTTFELVDGAPLQRIAAGNSGFALLEHDLSQEGDAESIERRLRVLMGDETSAAFDLQRGPLVRGRLVMLGEHEHVLLVTMHHIVMDGWSMDVMIRELSALYGAYSTGQADPLPELTLQYADYAAWQRQWLVGDVLRQQNEYWQRTLANAPVLLELPTDRPRPAQQEYAGGLAELEFDAQLTAALKALGRRHGTTLFMTLLAGWAIVLSRLSGQQDIVIGSPVANRTQVEVEPLIGFFVNTLALRVDLSADPTVAELLQRVKHQVLGGQQHQQLPFEQVVELIQPPRSLAHTPVFQAMLNWQDDQLGEIELYGLRVTPVRPPFELSKFDLTLDLSDVGDRILGGVEYATALFDRDTIERQIGYLRHVLQAMTADDQQGIHRIDLLGEEERNLLCTFNDTCRPELIDRSWPQLFDDQVARTPDRIAVQCASQQLTYRELHERSARAALALQTQGAGAGALIALLDQRGTDLLVMIVAVLRSGAAYLPLDPTHPPQRWMEILEEAKPSLLWVGDGLATEHRWLKRKWSASQVRSSADLLAVSTPVAGVPAYPALDDLAYVIFTSGSTGKPKGVMIEHRGMINNMRSKFEPLSLSADDVIAQTASQCFDISVWQFLTALLLGAQVRIVASDVTRDPAALLACLDDAGVTVWEPVPSVLQAILPHRKPLPRMRWVLPTGDALPRELVVRWFEQYPDIPLMNAYGPAECSDDVSLQPMHGPVERVSIGKPVANAHLHVVDPHLMRVPLGAVGELAVSGPVVGRGYLNRPDETNAAFRDNPYARHAADRRLYLTGDLVRRLRDGSLEFVGRKDFQVKVRGFRIELGEIESCLVQHPAVREAVAVARALENDDKQLVAYVTQDAVVSVEALRAHLRATLPDYMIPAAIVCLEALPLTPNGKVDRNALPAPSVAALQQAAYESPRNNTEQLIADLWQELLGVPQVGRGDSFFDLGGNSMLLIRMLSRLQERGVTLSVTDVYQRRTVAALSEASATTVPNLHDWLQRNRWTHEQLTLDAGVRAIAVLIVDPCEQPRLEDLKATLALVDKAALPDYVQVCDDIGGLAASLKRSMSDPKAMRAHVGRMSGTRGSGKVRTMLRAAMDWIRGKHRQHGADQDVRRVIASLLQRAPVDEQLASKRLRAQLDAYQGSISQAQRGECFQFSPIQQHLAEWQERDGVECIAVTGWYSTDELTQAFAQLASEQDLLRSVADLAGLNWQLLAADAMKHAVVPAIDARHLGEEQLQRQMKQIIDTLRAARGRSPLPYLAAWVSASDTRHYLLLVVDHLVWDGVSATAMQRRLSELLRGAVASKCASATYRDYVIETRRVRDPQALAPLRQQLQQDEVAEAMRATQRVLEANARLPLQTVRLEVPLTTDGHAAEQAFACFKRWVLRLTGLGSFGMVLNHYGRQLGDKTYFDHVGLFLDKIPLVATAETRLEELTGKATLLQQHCINYVGMEQGIGTQQTSTLPRLAFEVLFNFQADVALEHPAHAFDDGALLAKLKDYFGILFEAHATRASLVIHCAFRARRSDVKTLLQSIPEARLIETGPPMAASGPSIQQRTGHP